MPRYQAVKKTGIVIMRVFNFIPEDWDETSTSTFSRILSGI